MVFYDSLNFLLDPILSPFLNLGPFWTVLSIAFILALVITLVYKWVTDQELMKTLKGDIKGMQKEMKKFRKDPEKMMAMQKKAMEKNMKYMLHSLKPTLVTFIPIILIIGWLFSNMAYDPVSPGEKFDVYVFLKNRNISSAEIKVPEGVTLLSGRTADVSLIKAGEELFFRNPYLTKSRYGGFLDEDEDIHYAGWKLEGEDGRHTLEFTVGGQPYFKDVLVSENRYIDPIKEVENSNVVRGIAVDQKDLTVIKIMGLEIGWFWSYVLFSLIFSLLLRKILKVH